VQRVFCQGFARALHVSSIFQQASGEAWHLLCGVCALSAQGLGTCGRANPGFVKALPVFCHLIQEYVRAHGLGMCGRGFASHLAERPTQKEGTAFPMYGCQKGRIVLFCLQNRTNCDSHRAPQTKKEHCIFYVWLPNRGKLSYSACQIHQLRFSSTARCALQFGDVDHEAVSRLAAVLPLPVAGGGGKEDSEGGQQALLRYALGSRRPCAECSLESCPLAQEARGEV
jgi:hypothetical protein